MKKSLFLMGGFVFATVIGASHASAQSPERPTVSDPVARAQGQATTIYSPGRSRARGFFIGGAFEGTGVAFENNDGVDSGAGVGLTLGYGFTQNFALYGQLSGASVDDAPGSYGLGHFDLGLRVHFLAPAKTVVPFVQGGLSGRAMTQRTVEGDLAVGGAGVAFGGGINVHFKPALALSTGVTWSVGSLGDATLNGNPVPFQSFDMTSARIHVGIIWFPQSK